jgi:hypothetical protein
MFHKRTYEGVTYYRYTIKFEVQGKTRRVTHWSPGLPWLSEEVTRMLTALDVPDGASVVVVGPTEKPKPRNLSELKPGDVL